MSDFIPWLREMAENGGKGVVHNIDARSLGRVADELERLRSIAAERMDLFRQAASKVEDITVERDTVATDSHDRIAQLNEDVDNLETRLAETTAALKEFYEWVEGLNDFRPDSRLGRKVRAVLSVSSGIRALEGEA